MDAHSSKGLKTLELMGTKPDDWGLTPIRWETRKLLVPTEVECPDCYRGLTYVNVETGKVAKDASFENINDRKPKGWRTKNVHRFCPTCTSKRVADRDGEYARGKGTIVVNQLRDVQVGFAVWPKDVLFDSRFYSSGSVCELCSKHIVGKWSHLIPVNGRGADGRIHGMQVGEDCARKFLGIELVLDSKQLLELKKSERKQAFKIALRGEE